MTVPAPRPDEGDTGGWRVRRYRSRPVEVEAMQWTGERSGAVALRAWMNQPSHQYGLDWMAGSTASLWVKKAQRWVPIIPLDYVVAEPDGDGFYPCQKGIFEDRYDLAPSGRSDDRD